MESIYKEDSMQQPHSMDQNFINPYTETVTMNSQETEPLTHEPDHSDQLLPNSNGFSLAPSISGLDNQFERLSIHINKDQNSIETNDSSNSDLYTKINSKDFEIFHCISLLQHNSNFGIQYYICKRIRKFPISELRFFAPQFLQSLITMENQSMALEEMIKEICLADPHFSLITFWHLQAMLQDLSKEPESVGFQTCKRLVNELQYQLFNYSNNSKTSTSSFASSSGVITRHELGKEFKPNVFPSIVLATSILSGISVPESTSYVSPIVKMEGKRVKTMVFEVVKDIKKSLTENLTRKNTLNNALLGKTRTYEHDLRRTRSINTLKERKNQSPLSIQQRKSADVPKSRKSDELGFEMIDSYADMNLPNLRKHSLNIKKLRSSGLYHVHSSASLNTAPTSNDMVDDENNNPISESQNQLTRSMPDLHEDALSDSNTNVSNSPNSSFADIVTGYPSDVSSYSSSIRNSSDYKDSLEIQSPTSSNNLTLNQHQHVTITENQKIKLLKSSYFKNETQFVIALQNISIRLSKVPKEARLSTLKAELSILNKDLPCEIDIPMLLPKNRKGKQHKICRIAINESAVLNSAERVPYLILIEYLSDDVDFNPSSSSNKKILRNIEDYDDISGSEKYKFDLSYKSGKRTFSNISTSELTIKPEDQSDIEEGDLADISVIQMTNKINSNKNQNIDLSTILAIDEAKQLPIPPLNAQTDHENNIATQLRIASIMLTQLDSPNSPLPQLQASQIKNRIISSMQSMQARFANNEEAAGERKLSNDMKVAGLSYLGEDWITKKNRIRKESKFGHLENWDLFSMIAKTGDDLAQEAFACQLIHLMANIWYQDKVKVWVKRMKILVTSINTGLVETITNAVSVHSIKKALEKDMLEHNEVPIGGVVSLKDHFRRLFGDESSSKYKIAQENFSVSLAAYSVICYILQIKDRHNGNIMLDSEGHIVHIDFGFLLSNSPGSVGFESAPFKLTQEYVDLLGGIDSYYFKKFKTLTKEAFKSLRRNSQCIIDMVALMQTDSSLPCFKAGENTSVLLKQRFQLHLTDEEVDSFIDNFLISKSLNSAYTRLYDQFQLLTQGIYI
jgi:phosphatidylinositol 4-kinase